MIDLTELWKKRAAWFWEDAIRYLKVIVMGYMYIPIIVLISLAYLYRYLLQEWPKDVSLGWLLAVILVNFLTHSPIRTFIQKPDHIFLLPMEERMKGYMRLSFLYSFFMQGLTIGVMMLILSPLYLAAISSSKVDLYLTLGGLLLVKLGNVAGEWVEHSFQEKEARFMHKAARWILNFIMTLVMFQALALPIYSLAGIFLIAVIYYILKGRGLPYRWNRLIELEQQQSLAFYSFAHWFMDVPQIPAQVKQRKGFSFLLRKLHYQADSAYRFLFVRSLLRYNDIFYLYVRLLAVASVVLFFVPDRFIALLIFVNALFLNGLQLMNSWVRLKSYFWDVIYPLTPQQKVSGFSYAVYLFLAFQVLVMLLPIVTKQGFAMGVLCLAIGLLYSYGFSHTILSRKLRKSL